mgnify:CR=1 FL=1
MGLRKKAKADIPSDGLYHLVFSFSDGTPVHLSGGERLRISEPGWEYSGNYCRVD